MREYVRMRECVKMREERETRSEKIRPNLLPDLRRCGESFYKLLDLLLDNYGLLVHQSRVQLWVRGRFCKYWYL